MEAYQLKDSGVELFGKIPHTWRMQRVKGVVKTKISDGPHETPKLEESGIPFISAEAIKFGKIDFNKKRGFISQELHEIYSKKCKPQKFDIFIIKSGATTGNVAYVDTDLKFNIWSPLAVVRCQETLAYYKYIYYQFLSSTFRKQVELSWSFGTQENIGMGVLGRIKIILPSIEEQKAIANYLDKACKNIDETISLKQQQLLSISEQCKSKTIEVIRKGLNKNVELKSSNSEWLGKVPKHWKVKSIKRITEIIRGKFSHRPRNDPAFYTGQYPFIQTGNVTNAQKYITTYSQTLNEKGYAVSKEFPAGTLTMTIAANIGDVAILDFDACFPDSIIGFKPLHMVTVEYLYYMFLGLREDFFSTAIMTTQLNLNIVRVGAVKCAIPPQNEQAEIVLYLNSLNDRTNILVDNIKAQISVLKKYRQSLIHECVTGKKRVYQSNK